MSAFTLLQGDCRKVLATLPDESVHCCISSPPYWGLRDYQTAEWEGGDTECDHLGKPHRTRSGFNERYSGIAASEDNKQDALTYPMGNVCDKCGARRIDSQLGLEATPEQYVANMVGVFREVWRVLRDDGTLWLNLGDSYAMSSIRGGTKPFSGNVGAHTGYVKGSIRFGKRSVPNGLKAKDLVGIPWRVAFALQADGWYLRQDIIWHKPNPMPESVTDRCTKAHEYIFLLTKSARYYYDNEAVKEDAVRAGDVPGGNGHYIQHSAGGHNKDGLTACGQKPVAETRNKRSVWTVTTKPFKGAHFATFPPDLIEPCILAGCPPAGKRCDCDHIIYSPTGAGEIDDPSMLTGRAGMNRPRRPGEGTRPITKREQRWHAEQMKASNHREDMAVLTSEAFAHYTRTDDSGARPLPEALRLDFLRRGWITDAPPCAHPVEPAGTVLDPFSGAGTTGVVAVQHGRRYIGIELNPEYLEMSRKRIQLVRDSITIPLF